MLTLHLNHKLQGARTDDQFVLIFSFNASDLSGLWKNLALCQLVAVSMQKNSGPKSNTYLLPQLQP